MPTITWLDLADTLSCEEKNGVVRNLNRKIRVTGITEDSYGAVLDALDANDVPNIPQRLTGRFDMLWLDSRSVKMIDEGAADVLLHYKHALDGCVQEFREGEVVYGHMKTSLKQTPTNYYIDWDALPFPMLTQITVQHTYPGPKVLLTDPEPDRSGRAGVTDIQGGEVQVTVPQKTYTVEGYMNTTTPWVLRDTIINCINDGPWLGGATGTWLCTDVQWEFVHPERAKYRIEWQHNPDGWDPGVAYIDDRTHKPPPNLIAGVGFKVVPYYFELNFMDSFPAGMTFADAA